MPHDELPFTSATDALAAFRSGELSPVELLDAVLARAEVVEPHVNAIVTVRREAAHGAAREAEARYRGKGGGDPRPLEGLPVATKEEQPIAGEPLVLGSRLLKDEIAHETAPIVERIAGAGGVIHARTATPELSAAGFTHSDVWGVTRNPWNLACTPGGSSGGSAAALASGSTLLATGSDIGGSIRIPASLCGVIGYKPPYGRVPQLAPFNLDTYCHDGPLARTVADVALLHNVISGQHPTDQASLPFPGPIRLDGAADRVRGLRIAWARTVGDVPVEREVETAAERVASTLEELGAHVDQVDIPVSMDLLFRAAFAHYGALMGPYIDEIAETHDELLLPYVRDFRGRADAAFAELGYYGGLRLEGEIDAAVTGVLEPFDACILPTMATLGLAAGDDYTTTAVVVDGVRLEFYLMAALTPLFNVLSRRPVMAVPSGIASNGVPMGVQLVGRPYDDATVFDVAAALEGALGWWTSREWRPGAVPW
jgi:Asp-tRNA(Asn)/Glu-tRNA(Gln) amidotransferase A subunit family amidase